MAQDFTSMDIDEYREENGWIPSYAGGWIQKIPTPDAADHHDKGQIDLWELAKQKFG